MLCNLIWNILKVHALFYTFQSTTSTLEGNLNKIVDVESTCKHASSRGIWGHAPLENVLKMNAL